MSPEPVPLRTIRSVPPLAEGTTDALPNEPPPALKNWKLQVSAPLPSPPNTAKYQPFWMGVVNVMFCGEVEVEYSAEVLSPETSWMGRPLTSTRP